MPRSILSGVFILNELAKENLMQNGHKMISDFSLTKSWIQVSVITAILAVVCYTLLMVVEMPQVITVILASAFGPLLSIASLGLYYFMKVHRKTVALQIAVVANIIAGSIVTLMFLVQMAIRLSVQDSLSNATDSAKEMINTLWRIVDHVQLGMDVAWDVYICIGTFFFGLAMLRHPQFGKIFGWSGMAIGVLLLGFNLSTFPEPPANAGLIDPGPLVGLWYFAIAIQMFRSTKLIGNELQ